MSQSAPQTSNHTHASELLDEKYRKKRVGHRVAKQTRERLLHAILTSPGERVIALIGPTGVGKTLIVANVQELLVQHFATEMEKDPGFLPFISVTTVTGLSGSYSWRDGFARLLTAANEPLIGLKKCVPELRLDELARIAPALQLDGQNITTTKGLVKDEFRRSLESLVTNRRVRVLFLDEGSSLIDETVNRHPLRQFNILKSLAVALGIVIVLVGAYDLAGLHDGNGQLLRRSLCIHMPRYRPEVKRLQSAVDGLAWAPQGKCDSADDLIDFMNAATTLAAGAPVQFDSDVLADAPYLILKSVGCVGNFRDWVDRASAYALTYNGGRVTKAIFEQEAMPNSVALKLTQEAELGEALVADCSDETLAQHSGVSAIHAPVALVDVPAVPKKRRKPAVGKRGASRDPVGMAHA